MVNNSILQLTHMTVPVQSSIHTTSDYNLIHPTDLLLGESPDYREPVHEINIILCKSGATWSLVMLKRLRTGVWYNLWRYDLISQLPLSRRQPQKGTCSHVGCLPNHLSIMHGPAQHSPLPSVLVPTVGNVYTKSKTSRRIKHLATDVFGSWSGDALPTNLNISPTSGAWWHDQQCDGTIHQRQYDGMIIVSSVTARPSSIVWRHNHHRQFGVAWYTAFLMINRFNGAPLTRMRIQETVLHFQVLCCSLGTKTAILLPRLYMKSIIFVFTPTNKN